MIFVYKFICDKQVLMQIEDAIEKKKSILNLKALEIEEYPLKLIECVDVEKLYLRYNNLTGLDVELLKNLPALRVLSVDYNKITLIPSEIWQLAALTDLDISNNPIKKLPPEIGLLVNLESLWCSYTDLSDLPEEIGRLKKLNGFGAKGNKIRHLPKSFSKLKNLTWLTLENNLIRELPNDIYKLRVLIHLNVKRNDFVVFPTCVTKCKYLKYLFLNHNQLTDLNGLSKSDLAKMKYLIYIDMQDTLYVNKDKLPDDLKDYPRFKFNKDWAPPTVEIDESANDGDVSADDGEASIEQEIIEIDNSDDDQTFDTVSIFSDDWETSIRSNDDLSAEYSDEDILGMRFDELSLQSLSRFAGTGS